MRIAVLSDIHSNLVALDAVLAHVGAVDAVWHLGDVVGYGPEPDAVVERLDGARRDRRPRQPRRGGRRRPRDRLLQPRGAGGDGVDAPADLATTTRAWLAALPAAPRRTDFTLVHGSPRDPTWEYVTSAAIARAALAAMTTTPRAARPHPRADRVHAVDGRTRGRSRRATARTVDLEDGRALLNPGSVGQPRDGDPRASYLVLDPEARRSRPGTASPTTSMPSSAAMRAAGLPDRLAERLRHGV